MCKTLLLDQLLPADSVALGRLVLSIRYPDQDYYESETLLSLEDRATISCQRVENFMHAASSARTSGFHAFLSSLLTGARNTHDDTKIDISAAVCVTRQLQNSAKVFQLLFDTESGVKAWLERAVRRREDVFLVTGIKTVTNATVSIEKSKGSDSQASVQIPTTLAASAAAGVPIFGDALDIGTGVGASRNAAERTSFVAPGEQVFAIQYRRIRFARFKEINSENARLEEGVRWKMLLGTRGTGQSSEGSFVEAVTEDVDQGSLEKEGTYQSVALSDELFLYPADLS